jgi:hypothetical protein
MKLNDKLPKEANKYRFKGVVYRGRSKKEDVQKLIKKAKFIEE